MTTSLDTSSCFASAVRSATAPPNEFPTSAAGRCSATASTNENGSVGSGDVPHPGRSGVTTSWSPESASTCRRQSRESPRAEWSRTTFIA